jgi:hypothetical protein
MRADKAKERNRPLLTDSPPESLRFRSKRIDMGLFDHVKFKMDCPFCGKIIDGFQSKSSTCMMNTITPQAANTFYSNCECGVWVDAIYTPPAGVGKITAVVTPVATHDGSRPPWKTVEMDWDCDAK